MDRLPFRDFVTSRISHLKNIDSLNYANIANVDTFHYTISPQITLIHIIINLTRKVFKY